MMIYQRAFKLWGRQKIASKTVKGNNSESMKAKVVILIRDTLSWPVLHSWGVSWRYTKGHSSYGADMKLHLTPSRKNNSESMKARVVILVRDTLSWPSIHSCGVSWLYSKGYLSYRADSKLHLKWLRGNNSEIMTARVAILVCDTLSWPVLYNYNVSLKHSERFSSYDADTKLHLKPSRGKSMKARVVIFVRGTSSLPVLHNYEVSWLYSKQFSSYVGHEIASETIKGK